MCKNSFLYSILFLSFLFVSCSEEISLDDPEKEEHLETKKAIPNYSVTTKFIDSIGWGYQIYNGNTLFIYQKVIPSVSGTNGFQTEEKARITGEFVLNKIQNGEFPPSVTRAELDLLGVL